MASSRSGQIPINCQFCETEKVIKWKCVDCELLICDKCKDKIHLKIKGGKDHKILDIKEMGFQTEELNFVNLKCHDHSGQNYCLYCKTCESLVCPVCIAKIHKKQHDLVEITEEYNFRIDRLKKGQSKILNDKSKLETEKVQLKQIQTTDHANFVKVKENILLQEKAIIDTVRNYAGMLTEELEKQLETMYSSIEGDINSISIGMTKIDEKSQHLENLITVTDVADFFREFDKIEKCMDVPVPTTKSIFQSMPLFVKGAIDQLNFGTLVPQKNSEGSPNVTITVDTEYNTELTLVSFLRASPDGSLWITNSLDGILKKVKPEGTNLNDLASFNIKVTGMAIIKSSELLLKVFGRNRLQQFNSSTGQLSDSVYDAKTLAAIAIHVTNDNKVIVGGVNKESIAAVIVMNDKGHHERVYDYDQHKQPISTYPRSITTTMNGNIHVVDCRPKNERGRIVVLGQNGNIINVYSGHADVNNDKNFKPVDIATTPRDNIIVVDVNTNTLHIMNNTGHIMTYFNTEGIGIIYPQSVTFTHSGQLYIGCSRKASSETKETKLYKVNMSGC